MGERQSGYKTTKLDTLKELAKEMGVQYTGAKKALWDRITSSGHLCIISLEDNGQSFTFRGKGNTEKYER